jgi:hypothetical protein
MKANTKIWNLSVGEKKMIASTSTGKRMHTINSNIVLMNHILRTEERNISVRRLEREQNIATGVVI